MFSLNRATILGNLTRDPETKQIASGQTVCTFGVATNRSWTDANGVRQDKAEFHNIVAWGKLAEICGQLLTKGKKVYIEGRLQTRDWEGQDGVKRYRTEIVAENAIILDRAGGTPGFTPSTPSIDDPSVDPTSEIKVEDIPF
jgi:single-strand DNA-binding protein